jgi:catechol 2,3-dioxygenase-like lactoylglutathione lyase family enzyme
MLKNLNHLTLAITDLARSFDFYTGVLGLRAVARWDHGAYLALGELWLCLSLDPARARDDGGDYTHYAFSIGAGDIDAFAARLRASGVREWKENRSEGASVYFLDPDGHRLEAHAGDLPSRIAACRRHPYAGMEFFE